MAVYGNRARVVTATTGTGAISLGAAVASYQDFAAAGIGDGDTVPYVIEDGNNWEIGTGVYTAGTSQLTRVVTESSNSDLEINLSGSATVYIDVPASYFNAADDYGAVTAATTRTDDYGLLA